MARTNDSGQYRIEQWGGGYFAAGADGRLVACPDGKTASGGIALNDIVAAARSQGLNLPLLVRFAGILEHRVSRLAGAFSDAIKRHDYGANYHPVYPIKVNQQRSVVETIAESAEINAGFECGSKPELLAVMASQRKGGIIVCNGFMDRDYLHLGLIATRMGFRCYLVIEKFSELDLIVELSRQTGIRPLLGLRARLARVSRGHWQNTGGAKSKFGFSAAQLVEATERLREAGLADRVRLLHIHLGSQISSLHDIRKGVEEAAHFYAALRQQDFPLEVLDLGGGLGINYDGMGDLGTFSINYNLDEYADALVATVSAACLEQLQPSPELFTESGRALTAHHAVLITNVVDQESARLAELSDVAIDSVPAIGGLRELEAKSRTDGLRHRDIYDQANILMEKVIDDFSTGKTSLDQRSIAEHCHQNLCLGLLASLEKTPEDDRPLQDELRERLARRCFLNLSVFQSLPDIWALNQVFPIVPLQRLGETPDRRAVLCDLTCDSDGRIDRFVDQEGLSNTLAIHEFGARDDYLLGIFLVGAYQEILGDMHNLFGDTDSVDVALDEQHGFRLIHAEPADTAAEVLAYVHFEPNTMLARLKRKLDAADLGGNDKTVYLETIRGLLSASTYMNRSGQA